MSAQALDYGRWFPESRLGDVDAFSLAGLKCYFGSNDHYPQHFEVLKSGKWVIRVFILRSSKKRGLNWNYKTRWQGAALHATEEQEILEMVLAHKRHLLNEWNSKVCLAREKKGLNHGRKRRSPGARRG